MNLPNKLTLARIALIPVFLLFAAPVSGVPAVFFAGSPVGQSLANFYEFVGRRGLTVAGVIFLAAFATDALDGYIARKYGLVTDFGKFLDPIADKLLVTAALFALTAHGRLGVWIPVLIVSREFIVTGLRLLAAGGGFVLAADGLGKAKTVAQTVALTCLLFQNFSIDILNAVDAGMIFMYAALVLTIASGANYIVKNRGLFKGAV